MFAVNIEKFKPTQRLEAWRTAAASLIHPMAVSTQQTTLERGHIRVSEAYGLKTIRVAGCQSRVERNSQQINPDETGYIQLTMLAQGHLLIEQGDQHGKLQSGQITWYHSNSPYRIEAMGSFDLFHFLVSDQHKGLIQEVLAPLPAHPLSQNSPSTQILTGFLGGIAQSQAKTMELRRQGLLEDTLLHLLRTLGQDHARNESDQEWSIFEAALSLDPPMNVVVVSAF